MSDLSTNLAMSSWGFLLSFSIFSTLYQLILQNFASVSMSKGNWIRKRHKIKWHYLKLVFMLSAGRIEVLYDNEGIDVCERILLCALFQSDKTSLSCLNLFLFQFSSSRRRMIFSNPSKWYREMWLKIGGEPRCIFCQFLFHGLEKSGGDGINKWCMEG